MDSKEPGCLTCLWVFPARGMWLHEGRFMGLEGIPSEQTLRQCCRIYVHLWLLVSFENHAAEESRQETSEELRECGTADTCSSSVLWT